MIVDGSVWGVLAVGAAKDGPPLPADASDRLVGFTELVTTTLINAETRDSLRSLVDEQAALRRVATLVAAGIQPDELFSASFRSGRARTSISQLPRVTFIAPVGLSGRM